MNSPYRGIGNGINVMKQDMDLVFLTDTKWQQMQQKYRNQHSMCT